MTLKRTLALALSTSAVLAMALPGAAQLRAEPITPKETISVNRPGLAIGHERLAGKDRFETALAVTKKLYADKQSTHVLIASGDNFPDAISALNYSEKGKPVPILLAPREWLSQEVIAELKRIAAPNAQVTIIGGYQAIDKSAEAKVKELGFNVRRISGGDRTETALKIASGAVNRNNKIGVVSDANDFAQSMVAAIYAQKINAPHLLTAENGSSQQNAEKWFKDRGIQKVEVFDHSASDLVRLPKVEVADLAHDNVWLDYPICIPEDSACLKLPPIAPTIGSAQSIAEYMLTRHFADSTNYVVISGDRAVDGIAAGQLAAAVDAPIIPFFAGQSNNMGSTTDSLNYRYPHLMRRREPRSVNIYFIGGTQSVSKNDENEFLARVRHDY